MENEHFCCVPSPKLSYNNYRKLPRKVLNKVFYYMAESVFAMRLVNLRSVTCYTNQNCASCTYFRSPKQEEAI